MIPDPQRDGTNFCLTAWMGRSILDAASSTTLADLFTPLRFGDLSSAVRTPLRRWTKNEVDDGVAHGRQAWLRWRPVDSFFSVPLWRCGSAARRRKLSS